MREVGAAGAGSVSSSTFSLADFRHHRFRRPTPALTVPVLNVQILIVAGNAATVEEMGSQSGAAPSSSERSSSDNLYVEPLM
jgi:hypothetical protein